MSPLQRSLLPERGPQALTGPISGDARMAPSDLSPGRSQSRSADRLGFQPRSPEPATKALIKASRTGLEFKHDLPYEAWRTIGAKLAERVDSSCWWLGDWLVFGERRYHRYQDALEMTGLEYGTLRNYATVARRFPLSRRRDSLTFQHHATVCSLRDDVQDRWLALAAENAWSVRELRKRMHELPSGSSDPATRLLRVSVPERTEALWRGASDRAGCSLDQWIIETLNAAAQP